MADEPLSGSACSGVPGNLEIGRPEPVARNSKQTSVRSPAGSPTPIWTRSRSIQVLAQAPSGRTVLRPVHHPASPRRDERLRRVVGASFPPGVRAPGAVRPPMEGLFRETIGAGRMKRELLTCLQTNGAKRVNIEQHGPPIPLAETQTGQHSPRLCSTSQNDR